MRFFIHCLSAALLAAQAPEPTPPLPDPVAHARTLYEKGEIPAAIDFLQITVRARDFSQRPAAQRASLWASLGTLAHELGDYRLAEHAYRQSSRHCGPGDAGELCAVAASNSLAAIYLESGDLHQAEREVQSNARRHLDKFGVDAPEVLRWWANRGSLDYGRDRPQQALLWYRRALDGWTRRGETHSLDGVIALSNVGLALLAAGQHHEAVAALESALKGVESLPPHVHGRLPVALLNLGIAKALSGQTAHAGVILRRAVDVSRARLGPAHPVTAMALLRYGEFEMRWGNKREGKRTRQQAIDLLSVYQRYQGVGHTVDVKAFTADK